MADAKDYVAASCIIVTLVGAFLGILGYLQVGTTVFNIGVALFVAGIVGLFLTLVAVKYG